MLDERERQAENDAQINILKQMLLGSSQKTDSLADHRSSVRGPRHKSYHEGDTRGDNYKQMLESLLAETKMADRTLSSDAEADRSGYVFLRHVRYACCAFWYVFSCFVRYRYVVGFVTRYCFLFCLQLSVSLGESVDFMLDLI